MEFRPRFRDRAEELGQDMKDFDEGIINKDIYNQLKKEGLLNDARSTITMPVDMVTEIYQKKQPKPTDYINVKGKGLFSFNNTLDLLYNQIGEGIYPDVPGALPQNALSTTVFSQENLQSQHGTYSRTHESDSMIFFISFKLGQLLQWCRSIPAPTLGR